MKHLFPWRPSTNFWRAGSRLGSREQGAGKPGPGAIKLEGPGPGQDDPTQALDKINTCQSGTASTF